MYVKWDGLSVAWVMKVDRSQNTQLQVLPFGLMGHGDMCYEQL